MKASELIFNLQMAMEKFGDMDVISGSTDRNIMPLVTIEYEPYTMLTMLPVTPKAFWRRKSRDGLSCFVITALGRG